MRLFLIELFPRKWLGKHGGIPLVSVCAENGTAMADCISGSGGNGWRLKIARADNLERYYDRCTGKRVQGPDHAVSAATGALRAFSRSAMSASRSYSTAILNMAP